MLIKIKKGLQSKNIMGLSDADIDQMIKDPNYNYLRVKGFDAYHLDRKGSVLTIEGIPMNIHKDYAVVVQPNPELYKYGMVSFSPIITGESTPKFYIKAHQAGPIELEWLYEIRLMQ